MLLFYVFSPHLRFNNMVLISPHGLPGECGKSFLSSQECFTHDEMAQISLRTWVNVVSAKVVAINRWDNTKLILSYSLTFTVPNPLLPPQPIHISSLLPTSHFPFCTIIVQLWSLINVSMLRNHRWLTTCDNQKLDVLSLVNNVISCQCLIFYGFEWL